MVFVTEAVDTFLGTRFLFVPTTTTKGSIKLMFVQRLFQPFCFHHMGVLATVGQRIKTKSSTFFVDVTNHFQPKFTFDVLVAKLVHVLELPRCINVHERERWLSRIESLKRQVKHHRRVLTDRVQHDRVIELGRNLADDVNTLGFQLLQVSQRIRRHRGSS